MFLNGHHLEVSTSIVLRTLPVYENTILQLDFKFHENREAVLELERTQTSLISLISQARM